MTAEPNWHWYGERPRRGSSRLPTELCSPELRVGDPIAFGGGELQADYGCGARQRLGVNYAGLGLETASARRNHDLVARAPLASGQHAGAMTADVLGEACFYGG